MLKMKAPNLSQFQSLPRPILKLVSAALLIPATLDHTFDIQKFDALLMFIGALYAVRGGEKVADMITGGKRTSAQPE